MTTPDGLYFTLRPAAARGVAPEVPDAPPADVPTDVPADPANARSVADGAPLTDVGGDSASADANPGTPPNFEKGAAAAPRSWLRQVRDGCRVEEFGDGTYRIESIADGRHVTVTAEQYLRDARPLFWLENTP